MDSEIVGAGLAGLALAKQLERRGIIAKVVETRERVGGIFIIDREARAEIERLEQEIEVELGSTALAIGGTIEIVSESGRRRPERAVAATGYRVRTPAELGILGDRPTGIYPFHAALDFLLEGLDIGREVVIYGINRHSLSLSEILVERARKVTLVGKGGARAPNGVELIEGRVRAVRGQGRLREVLTETQSIKADALIIAHFAPWNQLSPLPAVGQAAELVDSPNVVAMMSELFAKNEACEGGQMAVKIIGRARLFPPKPKVCLEELLVFSERPVLVNGIRYETSTGYALVRVKDEVEVISI